MPMRASATSIMRLFWFMADCRNNVYAAFSERLRLRINMPLARSMTLRSVKAARAISS